MSLSSRSLARHEEATCSPNHNDSSSAAAAGDSTITIIGYGSLLSETSSRLTFPDLTHFRLARVPHYRRVFSQPAAFHLQAGITDLATLQIASLAVEYVGPDYPGFVAAVFDVPNNEMMADGVPSPAFLEREKEYHIAQVPFMPLSWVYDPTETETLRTYVASSSCVPPTTGIICLPSTDAAYVERWGQDEFDQNFVQHGVHTIWNWSPDSGLRPGAVYLRHCYLAAQRLGRDCLDSFLDDTYLVDRVTTIRQYLQEHSRVLEQLPPPHLAVRFGG